MICLVALVLLNDNIIYSHEKRTIMKTKSNLFKNIVLATAALATVAFFSACSKSDDTPATQSNYTVSGNGSGSQVVPAVSGSGTASITGTFNPNNNQLIFTSSWTTLSGPPIAAAFYTGAAGVNGAITGDVWTFPAGTTASGSLTDTLTLSASQAAQLTAGNLYYLYVTTLNPSGEVRGQVTAR